MQAIHSIKRDLILALCITALVFVCALAWGHPFFGPAGGSAAPASVAAQQSHAPSVTLTGIVEQNGGQFFLRADSGHTYQLDDPGHVQTYNGRSVTITGNLDAGAQSIHVQHIDSAA